ncbi:hypothetical protein D3C73_1481940 [compost metagenome]
MRLSDRRRCRIHFRKAEQTDRDNGEFDAVEQPYLAEIEARQADHRVEPDRADEEAGKQRHHRLVEIAAAEHADKRQREDHQRGHLDRPEGDRGLGDGGGKSGEQDEAD